MTGKEKWNFATGDRMWSSSPAVANGVVYFGSDDKNLYAIDAVTGKEKWRFATGDRVWSSPAVANGIVYVGSRDNNLYAIDAVTGKERWRFATGDWVDSSPAVANGIIYVGSNDKNLYAIGVNSSSLTTVPTTIPLPHITLPRDNTTTNNRFNPDNFSYKRTEF